jgi:large conductance mechanosensitive channel
MSIAKEFREFAVKGNVVDLAVGVVIGAAFGAIVKSMVDDLIMPLLGLALRGVDFTSRFWVLAGSDKLVGNETLAQARTSGAVVLAYGDFLNAVLTFILVAWAVFLLVKAMNRLRRKAPPPPPATRPCPQCDSPISLKAKRCPHCTSALE